MAKILIVDDNPNNIQLLATILSKNKYDVEYAENGYDAIDSFKEDEYDLVLMDIMMPGIDGFETTRRIKSDNSQTDIPFIFITANTDVESISKAFQLGGVDYITKPFNEIELLARINTHLSLYETKNELASLNKNLEDIVEKRTIELQEAYSQLNNLDKTKTEFLNIISHEIRTPLNGIIGLTDLIKTTLKDEEALEMFSYLQQSQKRLEEFSIRALNITDLRTKGTKTLKKEPVAISSFINELLDLVFNNSIAKGKLINLKTDIQDATIKVDPKYTRILLEILLENAYKHTPTNGTIQLETIKNERAYIVKLSNDGNGFPLKVINSNSKFFISDHVDSNPGLDLFLCQLIVNTHGGSLDFYNDKGSVVELKLPNV